MQTNAHEQEYAKLEGIMCSAHEHTGFMYSMTMYRPQDTSVNAMGTRQQHSVQIKEAHCTMVGGYSTRREQAAEKPAAYIHSTVHCTTLARPAIAPAG